MKWNRSARLLAVTSIALASAAAWGQVAIGTSTTTGGTTTVTPANTVTGTPLMTGTAVTSFTALTPTNSGNGVNASTGAAGTTLAPTATPTDANPTTIAAGQGIIGGQGGPSGTPTAAMAAAGFGTGIYGTSHDFQSGTGSSGVANGAGMCTFCHTPHKAKSSLLLWNHTLSSNTFQWDVAATTSGTALPGFTGNAYNGPSAKCLSCHDGSVAIGDVGWFKEASATGGNALSSFKVGQAGTSNPSLAGTTSKQVGAGGNLSGNHPVAIPYPFNGAPNVYNGSTTGAQLATTDFQTDPTANNIRLYSDVGGGAIVGKATAGKTGIECSSCHDPHNKAAKDDFFLRGKITGGTQADGYICLQCHIK